MQRLKGLTTGSLPTFVDAGSNFASDRIDEDSTVHQLWRVGMNVTHIGDNTWNSLFPDLFTVSHPFASFDVWDLDTVDNGVERHIGREILAGGWQLIIAHCLGVDHCGHRYGGFEFSLMIFDKFVANWI